MTTVLGVAAVVLLVIGCLIVHEVMIRDDARSPLFPRRVRDLPCPVCGDPDRNCHGKVTSACGPRSPA